MSTAAIAAVVFFGAVTASCGAAPQSPPPSAAPPAATSSPAPAQTSAPAPLPTPPSPPRVMPSPSKPSAPVPAADKPSSLDAELKIDSQLLVEIHRQQGRSAPPDKTGVKLDADKRALVDVRAVVTPELQKAVVAAGGTIVSTSVRDHSILAWVPLATIEQLAGDPAIRAIVPAAQAIVR